MFAVLPACAAGVYFDVSVFLRPRRSYKCFMACFHGHPHRAVTHHTHDHAHKMITTGCALFAGVDVVTPVGGGLARSVARRHVDAPSLRRPRAVGREGRV